MDEKPNYIFDKSEPDSDMKPGDRPADKLDECFFERLVRFGHRFREINERLHDRLTGGDVFGLIERYERRQFGIVVYLEWAGKAERQTWTVTIDSAVGQVDHAAVICSRHEFSKFANGERGQKQPVLVDVVEFSDSPKRKIPIFIKAERVDDKWTGRRDLGDEWSIRNHVFKVLPGFVTGEMDARSATDVDTARKGGPQIVETSGEVMHDLTHDDWEVMGNSSGGRPDANAICSGIRILFCDYAVVARMDDPLNDLFKVVDVVFARSTRYSAIRQA